MERLVKGDVVLVSFPFSDLSAIKKRPALVAATLEGEDVVLCQITSKAIFDRYALPLAESDFEKGRLPVESRIRTNKLFTASTSLVLYKMGTVNKQVVKKAEENIIKILTSS